MWRDTAENTIRTGVFRDSFVDRRRIWKEERIAFIQLITRNQRGTIWAVCSCRSLLFSRIVFSDLLPIAVSVLQGIGQLKARSFFQTARERKRVFVCQQNARLQNKHKPARQPQALQCVRCGDLGFLNQGYRDALTMNRDLQSERQ
jgi:hypothetical protein